MRSNRLTHSAWFASLFVMLCGCGGRDELDMFPPIAGGSAGAIGTGGKGGASFGGSAGAVSTGGSSFGGFGGATAGAGGLPIGGTGGLLTGGSAGAAQGGVGGSAGAAQGGTGGTVGEICTNGVDDDGDGAVDCEDTDCDEGYTCAPSVPAGWQGPVALWEGGSAAGAPACSKAGGYPDLEVTAMDDLTAPAAQCAACRCLAPEGIVCPTAQLGFYTSTSCNVVGSAASITADECHAFVFSGAAPTGLRWEASPALGGACRPDLDGTSRLPPLRWDRFARACGSAPEGEGCGTGACVPRPSAPFGAGLCIYRRGDFACPAGPYVNRELYFERAADSRSCTECSCSSPSGASCTGSLTLATDRNCSVDLQVLSSAGQCTALIPDPTPPDPPFLASRSFFYEDTGPVGGSCSPFGGQPAGTATPADPVTICCQ